MTSFDIWVPWFRGLIHGWNNLLLERGACLLACGILAPWPGTEPMPPALAVQSLNHWTTRRCFWLYWKCVCVCSVAQSCLTLCNPMDCSPPGSSAHGVFQARIPEWVAISFSRGSSRPRDQNRVSCILVALLVNSLPLRHGGRPHWK